MAVAVREVRRCRVRSVPARSPHPSGVEPASTGLSGAPGQWGADLSARYARPPERRGGQSAGGALQDWRCPRGRGTGGARGAVWPSRDRRGDAGIRGRLQRSSDRGRPASAQAHHVGDCVRSPTKAGGGRIGAAIHRTTGAPVVRPGRGRRSRPQTAAMTVRVTLLPSTSRIVTLRGQNLTVGVTLQCGAVTLRVTLGDYAGLKKGAQAAGCSSLTV